MTRKILWLLVSSIMVLSLVMASCGTAPQATPKTPTTPTTTTAQTTTPATPVQEIPKSTNEPIYGGVLRLPTGITLPDPVTFDGNERAIFVGRHPTACLTNQQLWEGDWTKGPAGGYGTDETGWDNQNYDLFDQKQPMVAESVKWTVDDANGEGTLIYRIRQGMHYGLNPASEASRMVGGRELTADDVVHELKRVITDPRMYLYNSNPELKSAVITKTGAWEVTVKIPSDALIVAISRFSDSIAIYPAEVEDKYGDMSDWNNSVGTGPFILTNYVPSSSMTLVRNPNYWMKDPIGPGKGNALPYLDGVKFINITDMSTLLAGVRTGKVDQVYNLEQDDAASMREMVPAMLERDNMAPTSAITNKIFMRTDKAPFNDVRVRRALMMATDFEAINQSLFGGKGVYNTWPHLPMTGYEGLMVELDAPDCPESVKELYVYNPEKAKQLLAEAGYPEGFKTSVVALAREADYLSIFKDMWAKVGIDLELDIKDPGAYASIGATRSFEALSTTGGQGPTAIFYNAVSLAGNGMANGSYIDDPVVNEALPEIRKAAVSDLYQAMDLFREMSKHVMDQAYVIPRVTGYVTHFWWPWLKNYNGEESLGYYNTYNWAQYVWLDQDLKKSMGY